MKTFCHTLFMIAAVTILPAMELPTDGPGDLPSADSDPMRGKAPGEVRDDNGLKMKLVWCPRGFVTMENVEVITEIPADKVEDQSDDEFDAVDEPVPLPQIKTKVRPAKVFLTRGYWLGRFEVTQSEWKQVMKSEPWKGKRMTNQGVNFPATHVTWKTATEFCRKFTEQERQARRLSTDWEYVLPTEAQWERACRAGTVTRFSFGDDESKLGDYAWFTENSAMGSYTQQVGQKKANPWGLYDMHGNVFEWCRDNYAETVPGGRDPDVTHFQNTPGSGRVIRGGGWMSPAFHCPSAYRCEVIPSIPFICLGFRVSLNAVRQVRPADTSSTSDK
jgi:formylglycine-generating enzyme required for sulfatase activity